MSLYKPCQSFYLESYGLETLMSERGIVVMRESCTFFLQFFNYGDGGEC